MSTVLEIITIVFLALAIPTCLVAFALLFTSLWLDLSIAKNVKIGSKRRRHEEEIVNQKVAQILQKVYSDAEEQN